MTVYEIDGKTTARYKFHSTLAIDIDRELKPYSFYTDNEEIDDGILEITSFAYYIISIVYDAMRWMECWKEVKMDEEQAIVARVSHQLMSSITDETTE